MPQIHTPTLAIAYEAHGPETGPPVFLMHGFPDDVRAYDDIAPKLAEAGYRVIIPYLRGYGPTRFLSPDTPPSASSEPPSAATTGAAAPAASSPRYGPSASPAS